MFLTNEDLTGGGITCKRIDDTAALRIAYDGLRILTILAEGL